jgi:uncharacterized membrane protein (UPF0127 family)
MKMRRHAAAALLLVAMVGSCGGGTEPSADVTPGAESTSPEDGVVMRFDEATVSVEVVASPEERQVGLMHRPELDEDAGMLFLFSMRSRGGFWMKNTLIPLSIAYLSWEGERSFEVVSIMDMEPCRKDPCPSYNPGVAYDAALEVNQGWFERHDVSKGSTAQAQGTLPTPT